MATTPAPSASATGTRTRPTAAEVRDLLQYLGASVDVATADGNHAKADRFRSFAITVRQLDANATTSSEGGLRA